LRSERSLVGRARFPARDVSGQGSIFVQNARWSQPEQHGHHHQITRAERAIEPLGITEASGKWVEPCANAIFN
jgi:hypothetical protein